MKSILDYFNDRFSRHLVGRDICYNTSSTLDVYCDRSAVQDNRPVIIFWHGGSWQMGDKSLYRFVGDYLAKSTGAVVLIPNYQKAPDVKFPVFVDEAWQVVEWAQANSGTYGAHTDSYSVIGHSSGAHTAAMIAVGARRPSNLPLPEKCVSLAGPNCFVGEELHYIFGASIAERTAFPNDLIPQAEEDYETKFLLLQGRYDQVIYYRQQTDFLANLAARNIEAELIKTQTTHVGQIVSIGSPFGKFTKSARLVRHFLRNEN